MTTHRHHRTRKIHVLEGEYRIVDDPDTILATVLGSCVAACLRDPTARVGGMNHFLLPGEAEANWLGEAERRGVHLMELLVNALLKEGACRERLEGKLFGGARMVRGLCDIGAKNGDFAKRFLLNEGIRIVAEDLGGTRGRRLEYFPVSGRARQVLLSGAAPFETRQSVPLPERYPDGVVELF